MLATMATPAAADAPPSLQFRKRNLSIGERICAVASEGIAGRLKSGALRLDRVTAGHRAADPLFVTSRVNFFVPPAITSKEPT